MTCDRLGTSGRRPLMVIISGLIAGSIVFGFTRSACAQQPAEIDFSRDIRPILSDACFHCHGPDEGQREADLRLDTHESVLANRSGTHVVVPGDPSRSELIRRITATDLDERMPPSDSGRSLNSQQIDLLKRWVAEGAEWQQHWSFVPPERPGLPKVESSDWLRNGIDAFILSRLEAEGLRPSLPASKETLIRRVTLDLTGLPPTVEQVEQFLNDRHTDAYERLVDRLLASPRYGEHMAAAWLDAARYADTNGYQSDGERFMWRWRDWVINAYNANMPFDRFTIEQLAGDMLPNPTLDQRIATGFNRNHRGNGEGGVIAEEYAVEYVVDRVDTTFTVWMGLTMGCARCHDHKYDPLTQKEFYQAFAFFNNVPEHGKAIKFGNSPPTIPAPTELQQVALKKLQRRLAAAENVYMQQQRELVAAQAAWEQSIKTSQEIEWTVTEGLVSRFRFDDAAHDDVDSDRVGRMVKGELTFDDGRLGNAAQFDGRSIFDAGDIGGFGFYDKFTFAAWIYPHDVDDGMILSKMTDTARADGYSLVLADGKLQLNLVKRWLDDSLRVETRQALQPNRWHHIAATYDGSRVATGISLYIDGQRQPLHVNLDELNQSFNTAEPLRIGAGGGGDSLFDGLIDDVRIYDRRLSSAEVQLVATAESISEIVHRDVNRRTEGERQKLRACFVSRFAPESIQQSHRRLTDLQKQLAALEESFPSTMVMQERTSPRPTHFLIRGQYDQPGERVSRGVPASLPPMPQVANADRLGFAHWLVDRSHPLTARVAVNRYWQSFFGNGLVKTLEDFGSQGERPSHPELLDWLATEFMRLDWNVKALQREIVTSATYRQSSRVTPDVYNVDPENRLLARGPRFRLSAEMVRDQAVFSSGLFVEELGGPSVKPYQPAGLWKDVSGATYQPSTGSGLYRRSLYTFWKRTVAPPSMMAFDAAGREMCVVREMRTNTPLQALALMNDETFIEAARQAACRILRDADSDADRRLRQLFRMLTARNPTDKEQQVLKRSLGFYRDQFTADVAGASDFLSVGRSNPGDEFPPAELAAYTAVADMILNLDEVITKE